MYKKFVRTSNVLNFLAGFTALETRGAVESCFMLVSGKAGLGKTSTVKWWALSPDIDAVYIRATAGITPHWILAEIVRELKQVPDRRMEYVFSQAIKAVALARRPIIVDEGEHCLADPRVLESVRDISDLTEVPVILVGYDKIKSKLSAYEQLSSRISAVVDFKPLNPDDVAKCCAELAEVGIAPDLAVDIHRMSGGRTRVVLDAIANIERHANRNKLGTVTLADMKGQTIVHDWTKHSRGARP